MTEKQLKTLIARRDRLAAELAAIEPQVRRAINEFGREKGYLIPLRIEQVRPLVGLTSHGMMH
jgi:transposase